MDAGYSAREAKEKNGAVVLTELYDVLKENQSYDEKRYGRALEEMVQQSIDYEDSHAILTEWDEGMNLCSMVTKLRMCRMMCCWTVGGRHGKYFRGLSGRKSRGGRRKGISSDTERSNRCPMYDT